MPNESKPREHGPHAEVVETELRSIPFSDISVDPEAIPHRLPEDYEEESIAPLADNIARNGICSAFLGTERPGGGVVIHDGRRRYEAIALNIARGIGGFATDMPIPVLVILGNPSERALLSRVVAGNVQSKSLSLHGLAFAVARLKRLGMPEDEIAKCLEIGGQDVAIYLELGRRPIWMDRIRDHRIQAVAALVLFRGANECLTFDALDQGFRQWCDRIDLVIRQEEARRLENREPALSPSEKQLQRYLTYQEIARWINAAEKDPPGDFEEPACEEVVRIHRVEGKPSRLEGRGVSLNLDALSLPQLAQAAEQMGVLQAELREKLRDKIRSANRQAEVFAAIGKPESNLWEIEMRLDQACRHS